MSCSSHKYKPNKQGRRSSVKTTLPQHDQEVTYIIPGCLTQAQWANMLIQEDGDEIVAEIMDELLSKVMECCYEVDIERQIIPFTALWAKTYLTQTVEQKLLCLDEGEEEAELSRTEDSEPMPATPDSWAQGCVPVVCASHQPFHTPQQEVNTGKVPLQTGASVKNNGNAVNLKSSPLKHSDKEDPKGSQSPGRHVSETHCNVLSPLPQLKTNRKKKPWVNSVPQNVPGQLLPSLFCSSEKKNTEIEDKNNECSVYKHKATPAYKQRYQQPIPKLDPSCLPRHFILTEYEILDNNHSKPKPKKISALPKPEPKLNKQQIECTATSLKPLASSKDQPEKFEKRNDDNVCTSKHGNERHMSSGPQRLDTMVLEKNVSLLDPKAVDINHLKSNYPSQSTRLKPVQSKPAVPLFSVDQVTAGPPPKVTPLFQSRH